MVWRRVGVLAFAGELVASAADESSLHGALVAASWREFGRPLWWAAAIVAGAGAITIGAAGGRLELDPGRAAHRVWAAVATTPDGQWARIGRGAALIAVGLGMLLRPALVFSVLAGVVALALLVAGVGELAAAAGATRPQIQPSRTSNRRWVSPIVLAMVAVLLTALVVFDSAPASQQVITVAAADNACNGYVQLCDRPYNDVAFVATHNAMSAADEPGWFIPEQPTGLIGQLNADLADQLIAQLVDATSTIDTQLHRGGDVVAGRGARQPPAGCRGPGWWRARPP